MANTFKKKISKLLETSSLNKKDTKTGNTLLHTCVLNDDLENTKYLLEAGINPNITNNTNTTTNIITMVVIIVVAIES
jgi:ankyrin repeat protein